MNMRVDANLAEARELCRAPMAKGLCFKTANVGGGRCTGSDPAPLDGLFMTRLLPRTAAAENVTADILPVTSYRVMVYVLRKGGGRGAACSFRSVFNQ